MNHPELTRNNLTAAIEHCLHVLPEGEDAVEALVDHLYKTFGLDRFERVSELANSVKIEALAEKVSQPAQYPPVIVVYTPPGTPPLSWPEITRMFK